MMDARRLVHALLSLSLVAAIPACVQGGIDDEGIGDEDAPGGSDPSGDDDGGGVGDGGGEDDGSGDGDGPAEDVVDAIGSEDAIDIAAWNIENFPADGNTPALVADLVTSLGIDLVAVEEIADEEAFNELVELLPDHEGLLSFHEYSPGNFQKVGYLYRADLMEVQPQDLLFEEDTFEFPRPPFQVAVTVPDAVGGPVEFTAIVLHLKAGTATEDRQRRREAMVTLEQHVRGLVDGGSDKVVILGDYNEILTSEAGRGVFAPFLDAPELYTVETDELAQTGAFSFVPSERMLDHIVTTTGLDSELGASEAIIPRLDLEVDDYVDRVSDHLPVAISLPVLP
ncbi:MAG TPA: endonuclease/exonuclease/phosphatase family protein [Kofleriaceae bacterium]|nr:endonuclease/exonuclease/phosphatase family protein [Kofleriaceae bacterium]